MWFSLVYYGLVWFSVLYALVASQLHLCLGLQFRLALYAWVETLARVGRRERGSKGEEERGEEWQEGRGGEGTREGEGEGERERAGE